MRPNGCQNQSGVEMADIILHKNEVGGYAYNDTRICIAQVKRVLERQMFDDSGDSMKGLVSATPTRSPR